MENGLGLVKEECWAVKEPVKVQKRRVEPGQAKESGVRGILVVNTDILMVLPTFDYSGS